MSFGSYVGQVLIYTVSGLVVAVLGVVGSREVKRRGSLQRLEGKMDRTYTALVGEEATDLVPLPPLGLIGQFEEYKRALAKLSFKVDTLQSDVKGLVADGRTNGGSSSRDAINRIEAAVTAPLATTPEVQEIVATHEEHMDTRQDEILEAIHNKEA